MSGWKEWSSVWRRQPGFIRALWVFAFCLPVSIAAGHICLAATLLLWVATEIRAPLRRPINPFTPLLALFAIWAIWISVHGGRPLDSVPKLSRLIWFLLIYLVPAAVLRSPDGPWPALRSVSTALIAGSCVRAAYDLVRIPLALLSVPHGKDPFFHMFSQGSMRTPQFFMAAACFAVAALHAATRRGPAWARLALLAGGIVIHFKRGVWMASAGAVTLMAAISRRRRWLLFILLAAAACAALPPVRARWAALRTDQMKPGSRIEMWAKAAPPLMREYPLGMGWGAMHNSDLRPYVPLIEPKLNHLHNNLLQIRVELGRPGSALWLAWMIQLVWMAGLAAARMRSGAGPAPALTMGILGAATGLLLNGFVEYNFGAGPILMLYALLMGMTAAAWVASCAKEKTP